MCVRNSPLHIHADSPTDKQLDKTWHTNHPKPLSTAQARAAIIKSAAGTQKKVAQGIAAFSLEKESIISKGLDAVTTISKLMTNPLFQAIVAEGGKAAVQILHAEAADKGHHSSVWGEMLKQIYAIEQHGASSDEEKKEFEEWLETYLAHSTATDEQPAQPAEESAASGEQGTQEGAVAEGEAPAAEQ